MLRGVSLPPIVANEQVYSTPGSATGGQPISAGNDGAVVTNSVDEMNVIRPSSPVAITKIEH